jgi:adenylate cyclase
LTEYRNTITALVNQHKGRVVDSPGDNVLAEFGSVVDAVRCAVETQKQIADRNADLAENRRMLFRIGVNLGDIVDEGDRIYGDGVNIAARLEGLAEAGGICISHTAFDQVKGKLEVGYQYLGEHSVKNIAEPVRAYKILLEPETIGKVFGEKRKTRMWMIVAAAVVILVGLAGWYLYIEQSKRIEPASVDKMAFPLPEKPSIAVLPFENLSGDPNQEYFCDGLTEEIITGLSKVPSLFVIARNSSFIFKNKPTKIQQISEELGVHYVLEGSVRKEGERVRITTQLIDAVSGYHMWAKRYDRKLTSIFKLQDEIMRDLLTEIRVQLTMGEQLRVFVNELNEKDVVIEAWEKALQAQWHFFRMNPQDLAISKQLYEEAIEIDPNYSVPYLMLAFFYQRNLPIMKQYAQKALDLNDSHPMAHIAMGTVYLLERQWDKAIAMGERAVSLCPNGAEVKNHLGWFLNCAGKYEEAISLYETTLRLNPYPPSHYFWRLAVSLCNIGRYEKAVEVCKAGLNRNPKDIYARIVLAAAYIWLNRVKDARAEANKVLEVMPNYSIRYAMMTAPTKSELVMNKWVEAERKAGLPE